MARTALLCDRDRGPGSFSVIKKSVQIGTGYIRVSRRKISNFLDVEKLVEISLSELARVKENEFLYYGLVFILPSVTILLVYGDKKDFCTRVNQEYFLWHKDLKERIGNRGLRLIKKQLSNYQIKVLLSGLWIVNGKTYLQSKIEMMKRMNS